MDCIFDWFHAIQKKGGDFKIAPFFVVLECDSLGEQWTGMSGVLGEIVVDADIK